MCGVRVGGVSKNKEVIQTALFNPPQFGQVAVESVCDIYKENTVRNSKFVQYHPYGAFTPLLLRRGF